MALDFVPVPRGGLAGYVERSLKQALLDGSLQPGERLVTRDLAARLGTSPTPVREAMLKLAASGILDTQSQAFQVPVISVERYQEIAAIRLVLESLAAERAARHITPGEVAELRAINGRFQAAKRRRDVAVALASNRAFRFGLYEAARMPVLLDMIERLWLQIGPTLNFLYPQDVPGGRRPAHLRRDSRRTRTARRGRDADGHRACHRRWHRDPCGEPSSTRAGQGHVATMAPRHPVQKPVLHRRERTKPSTRGHARSAERPGQADRDTRFLADPQTPAQTSKFATFSALPTMKSRRGSTTSPIRVENTSAASSTSPTRTCSNVRTAGSRVVFHRAGRGSSRPDP